MLEQLVGLGDSDRLESLIQEREEWETQARTAQDELSISREQESILRRSIVEGRERELLLEARISSMSRASTIVEGDAEGRTDRDSVDTIRKSRIGTPVRTTTGPISPTRTRYSTSSDLLLRQTPPRIPLALNTNSPISYRSRTPLSYNHTRSASAAPILESGVSFSPSNVISSARKRNGSISSLEYLPAVLDYGGTSDRAR